MVVCSPFIPLSIMRFTPHMEHSLETRTPGDMRMASLRLTAFRFSMVAELTASVFIIASVSVPACSSRLRTPVTMISSVPCASPLLAGNWVSVLSCASIMGDKAASIAAAIIWFFMMVNGYPALAK